MPVNRRSQKSLVKKQRKNLATRRPKARVRNQLPALQVGMSARSSRLAKEVARKSIKNDRVSIFLSHKTTDHGAVRLLRECLTKVLSKKVDVFASEFIPGSADWFSEIVESLDRCAIFILLYSDDMLRWDWPLFEAGYYLAQRLLHKKEEPRIYVLRHEATQPPDPLDRWQHVLVKESVNGSAQAAEGLDIEIFLAQLIGEIKGAKRLPAWSALTKKYPNLEETKQQIVDVVKGANRANRMFVPRLEFYLNRNELSGIQGTLPAATGVRMEGNWIAYTSIHCPQGLLPWCECKSLVAHVLGVTAEWEQCLAAVLDDVLKRHDCSVGLPLCRVQADNRSTLLRPAIASYRENLRGDLVVHVDFTEMPAYIVPENGGKGEQALFQAMQLLNCAYDLRQSVILPALHDLMVLKHEAGDRIDFARRLGGQIRTAIVNVMAEYRSLGYQRQAAQSSLVANGASQAKLVELFRLRDELTTKVNALCGRSGPSDADSLISAMHERLEQLAKVSEEFLRITIAALNTRLEYGLATEPPRRTFLSWFTPT